MEQDPQPEVKGLMIRPRQAASLQSQSDTVDDVGAGMPGRHDVLVGIEEDTVGHEAHPDREQGDTRCGRSSSFVSSTNDFLGGHVYGERGGSEWAVPLLYVLLTASLAVASGVLWLTYRSDDYGLRTIRQGSSYGLLFASTSLLNIMAGVVVFGAGVVRKRLLSPSAHELRLGGRAAPPATTLSIFMVAPWPRRALWLIMMLLSLSTHLFVNTLITRTETAHDAYQVLVDQRFLDGAAFDVASVNLTRFPGEADAVVPFDAAWPSAWPGIPYLQETLRARRAEGFATWRNLSEADCRRRHGHGTYSDFRNVVMVTNWTRSRPAQDDNAVLAVGALSGSLHFALTTRLKALCPATYVHATPGAFFPDSVRYTQYLPDARSEAEHLRTEYGWRTQELMAATHRAHDMCYDYRPQPRVDAYDWTEQLALSYCLSEPVPTGTGRIVWNTYTSGILTVILIALALAMTGAWLLVRYDGGFKGGYPWPSGHHHQLGPRRGIRVYLAATIAFVALAELLVAWGRHYFYHWQPPQDPRAPAFPLGTTILTNFVHPVLALREVLLSNINDSLVSIMYGERYRDRMRRPANIEARGYSILFFPLDFGLHLFAAEWSRVGLYDRYLLSAMGDATAVPVPTLKLAKLPRNEDVVTLMSLAPPVAVALHFCPFVLLWGFGLRRQISFDCF